MLYLQKIPLYCFYYNIGIKKLYKSFIIKTVFIKKKWKILYYY